jgi:hypothetical protein
MSGIDEILACLHGRQSFGTDGPWLPHQTTMRCEKLEHEARRVEEGVVDRRQLGGGSGPWNRAGTAWNKADKFDNENKCIERRPERWRWEHELTGHKSNDLTAGGDTIRREKILIYYTRDFPKLGASLTVVLVCFYPRGRYVYIGRKTLLLHVN